MVQASSAEIFGEPDRTPQDEDTRIRPLNPYGAAKAYAHLMVDVYRTRDLHASAVILYNHESPRRPPEFVTRKVTRAAAAISLGQQDELHLGNLDDTRDWSFAGDVAEAMWLMLQQDEGDDYVVCSGHSRTVRELVDTAFTAAGLEPDSRVVVDPEFVRPPDPVPLVGDPSKARERLGWEPQTSFEEMIEAMVRADLEDLRGS